MEGDITTKVKRQMYLKIIINDENWAN
jgi:hypothetical protein